MDPSFVKVQVSLVSFQSMLTVGELPLLTSIPASSVGVPDATSLLRTMTLSLTTSSVVFMVVVVPLTVRPLAVRDPAMVTLPPGSMRIVSASAPPRLRVLKVSDLPAAVPVTSMKCWYGTLLLTEVSFRAPILILVLLSVL